MNKTLIVAAMAAAFIMPVSSYAETTSPAAAPAAAPANPLSFNVGATSNYLFRGVSQTHGKPAVSAGIDYAHESGFYVGAWASTITWVKDWLGKGSTELDVYGGYKNTFAGGDWNYDVGLITYNYPGKNGPSPTNLANPDTTEVYAALGYKWLTVKYSHAVSKYFIGWYGGPNADQSTRGSGYLELNAAYDLGDGWGITGHLGDQKVKNSVTTATVNSASYQDWKIGVTKDVPNIGLFSLEYSDTSAKGTCPAAGGGTNPYCWGTGGNSAVTPVVAPTGNFTNVAKGTVVLSFKKTF